MSDQAAGPTTAALKIGTVVDTFDRGRQQVMDVMDLPSGEPTVFLRPEHGGREWMVAVSGLHRMVRGDQCCAPAKGAGPE